MAALLIGGTASATDEYPSKVVSIVAGYPAGGALDVFARALAEQLSAEMRQSFIVDNKPGASESIAAQIVSRAKPDGHTLLISTQAPLTQNQFLFKKLSYNPVGCCRFHRHFVKV